MKFTAILFKGTIPYCYEGSAAQHEFGGDWGDPDKAKHIELDIPGEEYVPAVKPNQKGGVMLDPDWKPAEVVETLESRVQRLEEEIAALKRA